MKQVGFKRMGESDLYELFIDGKPVATGLTIDEVMRIISEKESEKENE